MFGMSKINRAEAEALLKPLFPESVQSRLNIKKYFQPNRYGLFTAWSASYHEGKIFVSVHYSNYSGQVYWTWWDEENKIWHATLKAPELLKAIS